MFGFRRGAPRPSGPTPLTLPSASAYVRWDFERPVGAMEWDLTIRTDPGEEVGQYLALFNGSIGGSMCYLGIQTNVMAPDVPGGVGKGVIFSTWWSFDAADTRLAPGGFRELGTHEGTFVGIRRPYRWTTGSYRVTLERGAPDEVAGRLLDWFELSVEPIGSRTATPFGSGSPRPASTGPRESIGAIRFPRRAPTVPATIEPGGVTFLETYSGAQTWEEVPAWAVDVMAFGDSERCPSGRTEYPRPYGRDVPYVTVDFNAETELVEIRTGTEVTTPDTGDEVAVAVRWPGPDSATDRQL